MAKSTKNELVTTPQWLRVGLEFVQSGVKSLSENELTERDVRLGVIEVATGIELLLKGRLAEEHWPLVFDDPKSADLKKYDSGDFVSLSWDQCLNRLEKACNVSFDEGHQMALNKLRVARNQLMHKGSMDDHRAMVARVLNALKPILWFLETEYKDQDLESEVAELRGALLKFNRFVESLFKGATKDIDAALKKNKTVVNCPDCHRLALLIENGYLTCFCCRYKTDDCEAAQSENESNPPPLPINGRYISTEQADECCGWPSFLIFTALDKKGTECGQFAICFGCGKKFNEDDLSHQFRLDVEC